MLKILHFIVHPGEVKNRGKTDLKRDITLIF